MRNTDSERQREEQGIMRYRASGIERYLKIQRDERDRERENNVEKNIGRRRPTCSERQSDERE